MQQELESNIWDNELLDFDFDLQELEFACDSSISDMTATSSINSEEASHSYGNTELVSTVSVSVNAVKQVRGARERRPVCKTKTTKKVKKLTADVFNNNGKAPNISRRAPSTTLCAFPTFDKCDSLVYFPIAMTKHFNSGDFPAIRQLFSSHVHKNCEVSSHGMPSLTSANFINLFELTNDFHPDSVMCVHTTKVVENSIRSDLFMKFTDNKLIYESAVRNIKDPTFAPMFAHRRSDNWRRKVDKEADKSEEERQRLHAITSSDSDFVVYANLSFTLDFDYRTRKVVKMNLDFRLSNINLV